MLTPRFLFLILCTVTFVRQTNAQYRRNASDPAVIFSKRDTVTREELQGTWICFASYYDGPANANRDDVGPYHMGWPETAIFAGDSLSEYNYPCEFHGTRNFSVNGDSIVIGGITHTIKLERDTLSICYWGPDVDLYSREYEMRRYIRGTVDPAVIAHLNKVELNRSCLAGTWVLVTSYDSGYDGHGTVDIKFPFTLPYTLKLTPESAKAKMPDNHTFYLTADGTVRRFTVYMNEHNDEIRFSTQDWYKGSWPFTFTYTLVK